MKIEDILDLERMSKAQRNVLWIARISWSFVAMEIIIISFTLPLFIELFRLDGFRAGLLAAGVLIGDIIGSIILGRLADLIGRRPIFQISLLWYSIFTALTALSFNFESLLLFRILAGIGLGGMLVVDPTLLSEFLPKRKRGYLMVSLDLFWPLGSIIALLFAYLFLVSLEPLFGLNSWRFLFIAVAFPAFMIGLIRLYVPESPFFLAKMGRIQDSSRVLQRLTGSNIEAKDIKLAIEEEGTFKELFLKYTSRVIVMLVAWCALNYTYYGLFLWLPQILNIVALYGNVWLFLLIAFLFQIPGYLSAMYLVERIGRKRTLYLFLLLSGITGISMGIFTNDVLLFTISMFAVSFFNLGAWGSVYPFTSELFPTKLRGKAFGIAEGIGKIVAVFGPLIFGLVYELVKNVTLPLVLTMTIAVLAALVILAFAPETKKLIFD